MKRFIAIALASLMLLSATACGKVIHEAASSVSASAGTEKYITLFEERVEKMPDSLVLATGEDATAYGVDVSEFVDDEGYTVRATDGDVVILAKTAAGIDRGVRHMTVYGNYDNYTYTYGEGYRIKNLTIEGYDIANFTVVIPDDADTSMIFSADELVKYIANSTGVTMPVVRASEYSGDHAIRFTIDYPGHGDEAFTVNVKPDGNIDILCGRYRGAMYAMEGLLRDIGWRFLADNTQYLYEADLVNLTSAMSRTEDSGIPNRFNSTGNIAAKVKLQANSDSVRAKYGFYGIIEKACHGLQNGNIDWQGTYSGIEFEGRQPCFTDDAVLEAIEDHYRGVIEAQLAAGKEVGREFCYVDASQYDIGEFCMCSACQKVFAEEGGNSGAVLRMTNMVADVAAEYDPEIYVLMLAYAGTNKPPRVTVPRDNVKISYCFYIGSSTGFFCSNHNLNDPECKNNIGYYEEFEGWKKICSADNMQVWYYAFNCYEIACQIPAYDTVFGDIKYLIDSNINCVMFCEGDNNDSIMLTALCDLAWYKDMTEEEYWGKIAEYFDAYYGASGKYVYEYIKMLLHAGDDMGCWTSFYTRLKEKLDYTYMAANFEYMLELLDHALEFAETEEIFNKIEVIKARMMYVGINATHESDYINGTAEQRVIFEERYTELHRLFRKHSILVYNDYLKIAEAPAEIDFTKTPSEHWCIY